MKLTPARVRQLIEISYVLEPLLDKNDCTTRYKDLPGKPLRDFIIAGINVGSVFEEYADSVINGGSKQMFSHYSKAISVSNEYKKGKIVNLGLVEMMFVFVRTRLNYSTLDSVLNNITASISDTNKKDVLDNLQGFHAAISTSTNKYKRESAKNNYKYFKESDNIYHLFEKVLERFPNDTTSGHQVAQQYLNGFPIVTRYVQEINEKRGLTKSVEKSFNKMRKESPIIKIGLLADLAAIAMFLYLSFQKPSYIIK